MAPFRKKPNCPHPRQALVVRQSEITFKKGTKKPLCYGLCKRCGRRTEYYETIEDATIATVNRIFEEEQR